MGGKECNEMIRICPAKTMPRWASVGGTDRRERYLTAKERPAASLRFGVEISSHLTPCKKCGGVNLNAHSRGLKLDERRRGRSRAGRERSQEKL